MKSIVCILFLSVALVFNLTAQSKNDLAKGKKLFELNCAACHGDSGKGDGIASESLDPRPRNLTKPESYKFGSSSESIQSTLYKGIQGTPCASYAHLGKPSIKLLATYLTNSLQANNDSNNSMDIGYIASKQWHQITNAGYSNSLSFSSNGNSVAIDTYDEGQTSKKKLKASFTNDTVTVYNFENANIKLYLRKKNQPFKGKEVQYCDHFSSERKISESNYLVSADGYCFVEGK